MEPLLLAAGTAIVSIISAVVSLWVARKKGLPAINKEIEARTDQLIGTLRDQVNALTQEYNACKIRLDQAIKDNEALKAENRTQRRQLREVEADLLELFRNQGLPAPRRLSRGRVNTDASD